METTPTALAHFPANLAVRFLARTDLQPDAEQLARFRSYAALGDPLADGVVTMIRRLPRGEGQRLLDLALREGLDAMPDAPDELVAFCQGVTATPYWVDRALVDAGARAVGRAGVLGMWPLSDLSLMGGYLAARAIKPLLATGELHAAAPRRLVETASWWETVTTPGAMRIGGAGYLDTLRVRVIHAHIRAAMNDRPDWDYDAWDHPVNQVQMAGTQLLFSWAFLLGSRAVGLQYSRAERHAIIHLWRYIGWLMGVDEDLIATDEQDGWRLAWLLAQTEFHPDADSRELAAALTGATAVTAPLASVRPLVGGLASRTSVEMHTGLSRLVLGRRNSESLGLREARLGQAAILALAGATFTTETVRRLVPGATAVQTRVGLATRRRYIARLGRVHGADTTLRTPRSA